MTKKNSIAQSLTKLHCDITNAPDYFVQVIFHENNDRRYIQGKLSDSQIWIYGDIRSGRTKETRTKLTKKIVEVVCEIADVSKYDIWVFLNCLEPSDMAEYGEILPEAGKEEEWFEKLPENLQNKLKDKL